MLNYESNAVDNFVGVIGAINETLDNLKRLIVEDHMNLSTDEVNWGHVGTADSVLSKLKDIEYALTEQ